MEGRLEARLQELVLAFTRAQARPAGVAPLLRGQPFSYARDDEPDLAGYSWRPSDAHPGAEWLVVDHHGRVVARLLAPARAGDAWTYRLG